jgi:hypothetical protein
MSKNSMREGGDDGDDRVRRRGLPSGRTRWAIAGIILGVVGSSWVGVGHRSPKGASVPAAEPEESDGAIDGVVRKVSLGIQSVSTNVRDRFDKARGTSRKASLVVEVNARLRQDKTFNSDEIDVYVEDEGTVILKGQVPDNASKEIAVGLTRDIRGVTRVEDYLAVVPRRRVYATASGDDSSTATQPRQTR